MSSFLIGTGFALVTVALVLAVYFLARWLFPAAAEEENRDLAGSVIFRISALHGLILALVFAQEIVSFHSLEREAVHEASALADIYNDIRRFDTPQQGAMQGAVRGYAELVVAEEWTRLGRDGALAGAAWAQWERMYEIALDLPVDTARRAALRDRMLEDIDDIAHIRDSRGSHAHSTGLTPFWFAAVSGVVLISLAYFHFAPSMLNLTLLSVFGAYTGIIMFLIYAFSNPFDDPGSIDPGIISQFLALAQD